MQRLKRPFIVWFALIIFSQPVPARAALPLAMLNPAVLGAVLGTTAVVGAAISYHAPAVYQTGQYVVDQAGSINRQVYTVQKVAGTMAKDYLFGKLDTATVSLSTLWDYIKDKAAQYPILYGAASSSIPSAPPVDSILTPAPGTTLGTIKLVGVKGAWDDYFSSYGTPPALDNSWSVNVLTGGVTITSANFYNYLGFFASYQVNGTTWVYNKHIFRVTSYDAIFTTLPPVPWEVPQPGPFVAAVPVDDPAVASETDSVIAANPKTLPPAVVATPAELSAYAGQAKADILQAQADKLKTDAAADPTNADLARQADDAQAAADLAKVDADLAGQQAESLPEDTSTTPPTASPAPDADLAIDLSPLLSLKDRALSKFPFSTIAGLGGFFGSLIATPTAPAFSLPMPFGLQPYNLSLSSLDGIAEKWRLALAFFFHAGCIYAIIRRYS